MSTISLNAVSDSEPSAFKYASSVMPVGLERLNRKRQGEVSNADNALRHRTCYLLRMAKHVSDWFLGEWLAYYEKTQVDVVKDLDWNKSKISLMINGQQKYTRAEVNELAEYLSIRPYELLMHPDEAMALRRQREDALRIVERTEVLRTGTEG